VFAWQAGRHLLAGLALRSFNSSSAPPIGSLR
jgi:hypothetical protein